MSEVVSVKKSGRTTTEAQLRSSFQTMKDAYRNAPYPSYQERKQVLTRLKKSLIAHERAIYAALIEDYGYRSEFDSLISDVLPSVMSLNYSLGNLKKWMKPSSRHAGLMLAPSRVKVHYQPLGVVGVITPWNFPFFLALGPTIQALAAGNRIMIKLSEFTPHAGQVMRQIVEPVSDHIVIVEGEAETGAAFSALPFDHLIFTGSTAVGKLVAKAAADNLTPITLEMGGKSPTIISKDVDMNAAVDAVIIGKSTNSGQICVAPDYVFVPKTRQQEFVEAFKQRYSEYHLSGRNKNTQTHIVSDRQFARLRAFLEDAKEKGATIDPVKDYQDSDGRLIYPHIVTNVTGDMKVLQEEIFGSILPVMTYEHIDEVTAYINERPRPLALYIMSNDRGLIDHIIKNTHSGAVSINDTAMHVMADDAPFGGIGHSGMGQYHGHEGFLTFSKAKTVLHSPTWLPKNHLILKYRDLVFKTLRTVFLR